ncbi:hypothetical protein FRC12_022608, partial [Ceratobasidium sp. 428]
MNGRLEKLATDKSVLTDLDKRLDPASIAASYVYLAHQDRTAWTFELDRKQVQLIHIPASEKYTSQFVLRTSIGERYWHILHAACGQIKAFLRQHLNFRLRKGEIDEK